MICNIVPIKERNKHICCICHTDKSVEYELINKNYSQYFVCSSCYFELVNSVRFSKSDSFPFTYENTSVDVINAENELIEHYEDNNV